LPNYCFQVPFFSDEEETPSTPKADALFIPRENPRALVIRPMDQWPSRESAEKASPLNASAPVPENGKFPSEECYHHSLAVYVCVLALVGLL
jgi:nuclear pore complex protein Nup98-Nup96